MASRLLNIQIQKLAAEAAETIFLKSAGHHYLYVLPKLEIGRVSSQKCEVVRATNTLIPPLKTQFASYQHSQKCFGKCHTTS